MPSNMNTHTPHIPSARPIEPMPRRGEKPQTWPKGRTCASAEKCPPETRLSIYNGDDECALCGAIDHPAGPDDIAALMAEAPTVA